MFRRSMLIVTLGLLMAMPALAQPAEAQQWAEKMFDHLSHDFGSVARGAKVEYSFKVTNRYKEEVHILSVSSSCGCTTPRISKETVDSRETSDVIAEFNTLGFDGPHSATVTVQFDRPYPAEVRLQIKGFIRKDVVFDPGKVDFGTVDAGTPVERKIGVHYAGRSDWQIVDVTSVNTNYEVGLVPKDRSDDRVDYELLVRLKGTAPPGYVSDRLTIVTNDARNKLIPLEVEGNVVASVSVSPTSLQLGTVKAGEKVTGRLIVHGRKPFKVLRVECGNSSFSFQTSDEPHSLHIIPVTFTAGDKAGQIVEKLRVITDVPGTTLPEVVALVEVRPAAAEAAAAPADAKTKDAAAK